ncbi:hypothetical protein [Streptomyces sp. NPDC046197]|uniref:hypothetical protein n=1 Tax=Streptomyces sp. NPDC046197 TaxID=3154337 RepID=UPI0034016E25
MNPQPLSSAARRMVFASLAAAPRVDAVVRRLGDAIALGLLSDGEQLPGKANSSRSSASPL